VQPAPLVDTWRRERHVLQVMPRERMRLELLFERDMTDARKNMVRVLEAFGCHISLQSVRSAFRLTELGGTNLRCQGSYERFNACTNLAALAGFHSS